MMVFRILGLILLSMNLSSCALWPYKRDFDCPVQEGLKCKSLYEISKLADEGRFGPDAERNTTYHGIKDKKGKQLKKMTTKVERDCPYCNNKKMYRKETY